MPSVTAPHCNSLGTYNAVSGLRFPGLGPREREWIIERRRSWDFLRGLFFDFKYLCCYIMGGFTKGGSEICDIEVKIKHTCTEKLFMEEN